MRINKTLRKSLLSETMTVDGFAGRQITDFGPMNDAFFRNDLMYGLVDVPAEYRHLYSLMMNIIQIGGQIGNITKHIYLKDVIDLEVAKNVLNSYKNIADKITSSAIHSAAKELEEVITRLEKLYTNKG